MTVAFAAKKYLYDMAVQDSVLSSQNVYVTYGFPDETPEKRWLLIGQIEWDQSDWVTNRSRLEVFNITVMLDCVLFATDALTSEQYTRDLLADFETSLKGDPTMNGLLVTSSFRPVKLNGWPTPDGYEVQFEGEMVCQARI